MANDVIDGLQKIREQVYQRLLLNPDYRTLRTLDKTINDILAIVEQPAAPAAPTPPAIRPFVRKEMTAQERPATTANAIFPQSQPTPVKLNTANLFPTHRVA